MNISYMLLYHNKHCTLLWLHTFDKFYTLYKSSVYFVYYILLWFILKKFKKCSKRYSLKWL